MGQSQTWNNETSEVWTPVAGEMMLLVLLTGRTTFFSSKISLSVFLDYTAMFRIRTNYIHHDFRG